MKHRHINFDIFPSYYPSSRKYLNILWQINIISIVLGLSYVCFLFWTNEFIDFIFSNKSFEYITNTVLITGISVGAIFFSVIGTFYYSIKVLTQFLDISKIIMFNFVNEKPLFSNLNNDDYYNCWVCDKNINKYKIVKKLNCPCQEHFHPDCIDKYLVLHKNYCRAGHKIAKYEHTV